MRATLVIPAAGLGRRFGSGLPKQFLDLAHLPILSHSLRAFSGLVSECVIAAGADVQDRVQDAVLRSGVTFPVRLVAGGATRMASVGAAVAVAEGDVILVHDAVRPLVPIHCIQACLTALAVHPAAVVAVACSATVKRAQGLQITETVARDDLWLAQTPQGFRRTLGAAAFERAAREGWSCSDDAQVLERAGIPCVLVRGDPCNLKITEPEDLLLAEAILSARCARA